MNQEVRHINSFQMGQGEPIFFQHGLAANIEQIKNLLLDLEGCCIYGIDCPGHGHSIMVPDEDISFRSYAHHVLDFATSNGINHAVYGGLSMGSGIALHMALHDPHQVKALILLRPAWLHQPRPNNLKVLLEAIPFMEKDLGIEHFKTNGSFQNIDKVLPSAGQSILGIFGNHQQKALSQVIDRMVNDTPYSNPSDLKDINCPCLIIGCEDDPLHPYAIAESLHEHIKGSILEKVVSRYIDENTYKKTVRNLILNFIQKLNQI